MPFDSSWLPFRLNSVGFQSTPAKLPFLSFWTILNQYCIWNLIPSVTLTVYWLQFFHSFEFPQKCNLIFPSLSLSPSYKNMSMNMNIRVFEVFYRWWGHINANKMLRLQFFGILGIWEAFKIILRQVKRISSCLV